MAEEEGFPSIWVGIEEEPVQLANVFVGQIVNDEIILTVGTVSPPMVLGTLEQQAEQLRKLGPIPITPIARIGLTRSRAAEFLEIVKNTIEIYDSGHARS